MSNFTVEETNLMCIYGTETRQALIDSLTEMKSHIALEETELAALTSSVLRKLNTMTDDDFEETATEFMGDFEE